MTETYAIEAENLVKEYDDVKALDDLSFEVEPGTVFGLLGPNGAGKSTTVKILTTLSSPTSGTGRVLGTDVVEDPGAVRRLMGVVAQRSTADREATARENLRLQGQLYRMGGRELEDRVDELLASFNLSDSADRIVRGFSGGMERRLTIAIALVHRPQVLFLDEPTTGLDPEVRAEMWDEISTLASQEGMTILLTTHYLEEADRLASNLAIVDRGTIVAKGSPEELKRELQGDAIHVELEGAGEDGAVERALGGIDGLNEIVVDGQVMHARARDGARSVPAVLQALEGAGIEAASVTISRPSLDDVYLRHAGRTIEQAEKSENEEANR